MVTIHNLYLDFVYVYKVIKLVEDCILRRIKINLRHIKIEWQKTKQKKCDD